jgi:hypothetical protein
MMAIAIYVTTDDLSARFCCFTHLSLWAEEQMFVKREATRTIGQQLKETA